MVHRRRNYRNNVRRTPTLRLIQYIWLFEHNIDMVKFKIESFDRFFLSFIYLINKYCLIFFRNRSNFEIPRFLFTFLSLSTFPFVPLPIVAILGSTLLCRSFCNSAYLSSEGKVCTFNNSSFKKVIADTLTIWCNQSSRSCGSFSTHFVPSTEILLLIKSIFSPNFAILILKAWAFSKLYVDFPSLKNLI